MTHNDYTGPSFQRITDINRAKSAIARLNPDEQIVLSGLANGESSKSLAAILNIEIPAIDDLRAAVAIKLNAVSTADAVRIALLGELVGHRDRPH